MCAARMTYMGMPCTMSMRIESKRMWIGWRNRRETARCHAVLGEGWMWVAHCTLLEKKTCSSSTWSCIGMMLVESPEMRKGWGEKEKKLQCVMCVWGGGSMRMARCMRECVSKGGMKGVMGREW
jgi:hypothetical protein